MSFVSPCPLRKAEGGFSCGAQTGISRPPITLLTGGRLGKASDRSGSRSKPIRCPLTNALEDEGLPYEEEALPRKGVFPLFPLLSISILKRVLFQRQSVPKKIASRDRITTKIFGKGAPLWRDFWKGKLF